MQIFQYLCTNFETFNHENLQNLDYGSIDIAS